MYIVGSKVENLGLFIFLGYKGLGIRYEIMFVFLGFSFVFDLVFFLYI